MKSTFLRFERGITKATLVIACVLFAIASCIGLLQIVTRFLFKYPTPWSEVTIRILLIWMVFLGIPMAFRLGAMVSVDLLHRKIPARHRPKLELLVAAITIGFLLMLAYWAIQYCIAAGGLQTIIGLEALGLKMIWAYLAIPIGAILSIVAVVGNYLEPKHEELENAQ
ncbi:MAG TPA: TRAP transporter small permease [Devosia sp.]|nr:TRAP transporter small permease [Devosia sp.]